MSHSHKMTVSELEVPGIKVRPLHIAIEWNPVRSTLWAPARGTNGHCSSSKKPAQARSLGVLDCHCGCAQSACGTSLSFSGLRGLVSEPFTQPGALLGLLHSCTPTPTPELTSQRRRTRQGSSRSPGSGRLLSGSVSSESLQPVAEKSCPSTTCAERGQCQRWAGLALCPWHHCLIFPHGEIEKQRSKSRLHSRGKKHPRQPVSAASYQARQTHTQDKQGPGSRAPPACTPQPDSRGGFPSLLRFIFIIFKLQTHT